MNDVEETFDDDIVDTGNAIVALPTAVAVCEHIVRSLVEHPDEVAVAVIPGERAALHVSVNPSDVGRVIGRRGRVAMAIRTLVRAGAAKDGVEIDVEFLD